MTRQRRDGENLQAQASPAVCKQIESYRVDDKVRRSIDEVLPRYRELFDRLGRA